MKISNFHSYSNRLQKIIGIDNFNTSKVTNMRGMFNECNLLENLNLSNFITLNVTDMSCMFNKCHKLGELIGINLFNTSKVYNMCLMFQDCNIIEKLDLSNFDTSNVTNMSFMFNKSHRLKEIKGIDKFNTSKVITMRGMFQQCNELEYLNLSNFDTSNVTDLGIMFQECFKLKYLDISNFNNNNFKNIGWMFNKCYQLNEIKGINILNSCDNINKIGIFKDCPELKDKPLECVFSKVIEKKPITISFYSTDQSIKNYTVTCYSTDLFETIREKIYIKYPQFKHKEIYFLADGKIMNERISLEENGIEDGTAILIHEM